MKKKIIALTVALVLVVAAAVSASLAYFTDSDTLDNSYSIGNVDIDAWETVDHVDGTGLTKIEDVSTNIIGKDVDGEGFEYDSILPGDTMEKIVTVDNNGSTDAYIAVAVKQKGWNEWNRNFVDNYYEGKTEEELAFLLGDKYVAGDLAATMQNITDAIFPGWGLVYDKYSDDDYDVRYYPDVVRDQQDGKKDYRNTDETKLIAIDYSVMKGQGNNKSTGYKNNMFQTSTKTFDNGLTVSTDPLYSAAADEANDRIWVYYYYVPAKQSVTLDLTVVCPTFFDATSTQAFADFELDVRAAAIQADGFATAKDAFTELNRVYGFDF
ncbi:MAG: hypothetical protein IJB76_04440 [Clostridia bacterium]|nr:hypothetical protein [Clostridia bacterium]